MKEVCDSDLPQVTGRRLRRFSATFPLESDGSASIVVPLDDGDTVEFSARNTGTTDDISLAHAHVYRVAL